MVMTDSIMATPYPGVWSNARASGSGSTAASGEAPSRRTHPPCHRLSLAIARRYANAMRCSRRRVGIDGREDLLHVARKLAVHVAELTSTDAGGHRLANLPHDLSRALRAHADQSGDLGFDGVTAHRKVGTTRDVGDRIVAQASRHLSHEIRRFRRGETPQHGGDHDQ